MTKLVTMTFEEASKWIASQEDRISTLATELAAAHIQCGHNQLTINALGERCSALEAALRKIVRDGDYTAPEGMKRIAQEALGSELETFAELGCPICHYQPGAGHAQGCGQTGYGQQETGVAKDG